VLSGKLPAILLVVQNVLKICQKRYKTVFFCATFVAFADVDILIFQDCTNIVLFWYVIGTLLVHYWYIIGTLLVRYWYYFGALLVLFWYVIGTVLGSNKRKT
jgi:hypothetical protein